MPKMRCIVVTPEETLRDTPAEFVAVELLDGELGIAPGHAPLLGRLGSGQMRITQDGQVRSYYVEGGFVEVLGETVTVLTGRAVPAESLDEAALLEQLDSARRRSANTPELLAQRDRAVAQCRAGVRVARRAH